MADEASPSRYNKTRGAANMAGEKYETKISALLFLRSINREHGFRIATNMAAAGSFDDIVFTLGHQTAFMQLKHRLNKNAEVYTSQLLTVHGDFSLIKYCKSYLEMKQQWHQDQDLQQCGKLEDASFIVYTNAKLVDNVTGNVGSSGILDLVNTGGKLTQFTEQQHAHIYELFRSLPRYKQLLSEAVTGDTDCSDNPELLEAVRKLLHKTARRVPEKELAKLLSELQSIGDLSGCMEFLSRLYFCSEQTAQSGLDNLIRSELTDLFGNDTNLLELERGVETWWRKANVYLTVDIEFFKDMIQRIAANITKDISQLTVSFVRQECDLIRQNFSFSNGKMFVYGDCTNLTVQKVMQSLNTQLVVNVSTLQTCLTDVLAVWRLGRDNVLVVEGETTDTNILQQLGSVPHGKGVVVVSDKGEHRHLYNQFEFVSYADTFTLSQLDSSSQRDLMECKVVFQGQPVKLNVLADAEFLEQVLTGDVVLQLHHTQQIGHKVQDFDTLYITRTFVREECVSKEIFMEKGITFAVTGTTESLLAQLASPGEQIQKYNANRDRKCRFFLIEEEAEFTNLCREYDNIHWIERCGGEFVWKMSKGDLSPVVNNIRDAGIREYVGAEALLDLPHQVVLLVAEPGMGKSTEMSYIAYMIKQKHPATWVVRVDLNHHIALLNQSQMTAIQFLQQVANLKEKFEKSLFEHQVLSGRNVIIILDGVDEVSYKYSEQVYGLLTELTASKVVKIFVTSRPVLRNDLEDKLKTLSFSFKAFTQEDQENFLMRYWKQLSICSPNLPQFITSLLKRVEKLREFTEIPLQCRMLAEVYAGKAEHFSRTGELDIPQSLDLVQLFEEFVDKKWKEFFEKFHVDIDIAFDLIDEVKDMFQQRLMCCALVSYLHKEQIDVLHNAQEVVMQNHKYIERFDRLMHKIGIVTEITNGTAVFVHRTFAEYFVALWFSQNIDLELKNLRQIIYLDENFEMVRIFLDRIVNKPNKLHTAVLNGDVSQLESLMSDSHCDVNQKDEGGRTALHLAVMNYFHTKHKVDDSLVDTLLEHGADVNCKDKVFCWSPLRLAEKVEAWPVVDKLLGGKDADTKDLVWIRQNIENVQGHTRRQGFVQSGRGQNVMKNSLQRVMETIVSAGCVNIVEFILKCGVSVEHHIGYNDSMLCVAARAGQLRLVEFLVQQNANVNLTGEYNRTPLMCAAEHGHMVVAIFLLAPDSGADVNARDRGGDTALTLATRHKHDQIVQLLLQHGAQE